MQEQTFDSTKSVQTFIIYQLLVPIAFGVHSRGPLEVMVEFSVHVLEIPRMDARLPEQAIKAILLQDKDQQGGVRHQMHAAGSRSLCSRNLTNQQQS